MRLKDDVKKFLVDAFNGAEDIGIPISHRRAMLKTLQHHGLVDAANQITKRGRHVASKLSPVATIEPQAENEFTEFEEWD